MEKKFDKKCYEYFLQNSNDAVFIIDSNGFIVDINKEASKLTRYSKKELVGKLSFDLLGDRKISEKNLKQIMKGTTTFTERYLVNKKGQKIFVEMKSSPLMIEDNTYIYSQVRDISERKKLQDELIASKEDIQKRLNDLTVMYKITRETTKIKDIDRLLKRMIKILSEDLSYEKCFIAIIEDNLLKFDSNYKLNRIENIRWKILNGGGITGHVMKTGEPLLLKDPLNHPKYIPALKRTKCELTIPITIDNQVIGVIDVESTKKNTYDESDLKFLTNITNHVALAIENIWLNIEQKKKINRLNMMYELGKVLSSTFEQKSLFDEVTKVLSRMNNAKIATLFMLDNSGNELYAVSSYHKGKKFKRELNIDVKRSVTGESLKKGIPIQVVEPTKHSTFSRPGKDFAKKNNIHSFLTMPLRVDNTTIGAINIYSESPRKFSEGQLNFVESVADHVSIIIRNARLYNRLKDFNEILQEETYAATREIREKNKELRKLTNTSISEKNKIEAIIDSISEGIIVTYFDSPIMSFNPATEQILQFDSEKLGPKATTNYLTNIGIITVLEQAKSLNQPVFIKEIRLGNPVNKYIKVMINTLKDQEKQTIGLVTVLTDITKIKEIDRMKSEFVSVVSHELRTPLTSIKGYSSLLLNEKVGRINAQQKQCLEILNAESDRLATLINDVLDLSKMESGKMSLKLEDQDLASIIIEVVKSFEVAAKEKSISLQYDITNKLPDLPLDKDKIKQVLINLISNAIKFTDNGGKVKVRAKAGTNYVRVGVEDNGRGIKKEDIPKIFNKFFQIDSHMTRSEGGSGLGLVIAKELIGMHNGMMDVESEEGKGSRFIFLLPQKPMIAKEKLKKCWEEMNCNKVTCPAYGSSDRRCWLIPGTECNFKEGQCETKDKIGMCKYCPMHLAAFKDNQKNSHKETKTSSDQVIDHV